MFNSIISFSSNVDFFQKSTYNEEYLNKLDAN